jgi:hypothetical protein
MVTSPYKVGVYDLRWDDPSTLTANTPWDVVGINVYRSDASDRGPFRRVNEYPVGSGFYRDATDNALVRREVVEWDTGWVSRGDSANNKRWKLKSRWPMVKQDGQAVPADVPVDVLVEVDGRVAEVQQVFGPTGEVVLVNTASYNAALEIYEAPVLPTGPDSAVTVTYYRSANLTPGVALDRKVFYRLTTVAATADGLLETEIDQCPPISPTAVEELDYIWREAVRRNQWILQQGGERVKLFVRKQAGVKCDCGIDPQTLEYTGQPSNRCTRCFGVGWLGGYEGPYEIIVAPDDAERRVAQHVTGRKVEHTYEVFMGPSPMVTMRDLIVKQTNERYSIGAVRRPSNRGNVLQQHYTIGLLDEGDIRYKVPVDGTDTLAWPETRYSHSAVAPAYGQHPHEPPHPVGPDATTPMATEKQGHADENEKRGRSPVWANQNT